MGQCNHCHAACWQEAGGGKAAHQPNALHAAGKSVLGLLTDVPRAPPKPGVMWQFNTTLGWLVCVWVACAFF